MALKSQAWQRDVLMYKSVALANLAYIYLPVRTSRAYIYLPVRTRRGTPWRCLSGLSGLGSVGLYGL